MAENKITLGQLVNVITESGIDLNEIYLDENQINGMQTSLSEENQNKLVSFVSELMKSVPEDELTKISGGISEKVKKGLKIGGSVVGSLAALATVVGTGVELLGRYGPSKAQKALDGWTPSALGGAAWTKLTSKPDVHTFPPSTTSSNVGENTINTDVSVTGSSF